VSILRADLKTVALSELAGPERSVSSEWLCRRAQSSQPSPTATAGGKTKPVIAGDWTDALAIRPRLLSVASARGITSSQPGVWPLVPSANDGAQAEITGAPDADPTEASSQSSYSANLTPWRRRRVAVVGDPCA
jgi:hypothetical protein